MGARKADHIQRDLEARGVSPDLAPALSRRLVTASCELSADAYDAVLTGVAIAYGRGHRSASQDGDPAAGIEEVQRLMGAFNVELRKLEEALETLAAYVTRIRSQTRPKPSGRTLH